MFSLSPMKIFVIVAVVVMLLGPDKLPEVAHRLGTWWNALRRFQQRVESEVRGALPDLPSTSDIARITRNPVSVLNDLADRAENPTRERAEAAPTPDPVTSDATETSAAPPSPPSADPSLN